MFVLTVLVEQQHQIFPVEGVDGEQQSRTLPGPEAQRDVLSSQRHVRVDERRPPAAVPAQNVELLEGVGDGRGGSEDGRDLWEGEGQSDGVSGCFFHLDLFSFISGSNNNENKNIINLSLRSRKDLFFCLLNINNVAAQLII